MLQKLGGDENLLKDVVVIFLEEAPKAMTSLHDAAQQGNAAIMERVAHTLKGDLGYLGLPEIVQLAAELEDLSRSGDLHLAREKSAAFEREIAAVCLEVTKSIEAGSEKHRVAGAGESQ